MHVLRISAAVTSLCLLQAGCVDPSAPQPGTPQVDSPDSAADAAPGDAALEDNAAASNESGPTQATSADQGDDLQWLAESGPLSDEAFATIWPRMAGTWSAVRIDKYLIEDGTVTRLDSSPIPPQFITTVIDDETWTTTRRRQSQTESADAADMQERVRDRHVALAGGELYVLMIEANVNGGAATEKHFTVFSRE